jgi:2,4-dienoyl-CoA reductase (NADPH2)
VHSGPDVNALLASGASLPIGRRVVIVGGDLASIQLAEFLAAQDRFVTVLESGRCIAPQVGLKRRTEHMDRLDRLAVPVHVRAEVHRITDGGAAFTPYGGSRRELPADSVIVAGHPEADTALFDALTDRLPGAKVHAVGDCTGLGLIRKATEDGARAACSI